MHNIDLILTLTSGLVAALTLGYITHRLGLSPIVGYLLAGIAVGPYTPGIVANLDIATQMAEVGVILLMFGVGLHFHIKELLAVRHIAIPGAVGQSIIATVLGALLAVALGFDWSAGVVFGLAISVASTVVLTRVLSDNRELHTPTGHIAVGWLVVEDLFTVVVLVLLPALAAQNGGAAGAADAAAATSAAAPHADAAAAVSLPIALLLAAGKIVLLVVFTFVVGGRVIPWLLEKSAQTKSRELFTLSVLALALGIAVGSALLFGVSMALGAFLAGMVVGRSEFSLRAASEALPMRDAFAVLFFVSVGMLLNPSQLLDSPVMLAGALAIILIGKPAAALGIVLLLGYPLRTALVVSVALAQIGEFSFIMATLANQLHIFSAELTNTLVAAAILSITLNPLLFRLIVPAEHWIARRRRLYRFLTARTKKAQALDTSAPHDPLAGPSHRIVIVGFGPVGQTLTRLLRENRIEPTIIELNLDTVRRLRAQGIKAVYGDTSHRETLVDAGVAEAGTIILSAAGISASEEVIRLARELNPDIRVLARSAYLREVASLRRAGADDVFAGEGEVAMAMTVAILRELGATPDQIDKERERVQDELFGQPAAPMHSATTAAGPAPAASLPPDSAAAASAADDAPSQ